jgi:hypothetical protein
MLKLLLTIKTKLGILLSFFHKDKTQNSQTNSKILRIIPESKILSTKDYRHGFGINFSLLNKFKEVRGSHTIKYVDVPAKKVTYNGKEYTVRKAFENYSYGKIISLQLYNRNSIVVDWENISSRDKDTIERIKLVKENLEICQD